jgi:flagellar biosynthesis chaperone FliJ
MTTKAAGTMKAQLEALEKRMTAMENSIQEQQDRMKQDINHIQEQQTMILKEIFNHLREKSQPSETQGEVQREQKTSKVPNKGVAPMVRRTIV